MSEEERKGAIEIIRTLYGVHRSEDYQKAFDVIIAALSAEPCEDAISRQAVHEAIEKWASSMSVLIALPTREVRPLLDSIYDLPSVNPQPKTGHWKYAEQLQTEICSCCGCIKGNYFFSDIEVPIKFCPNCGATMTESEDKE